LVVALGERVGIGTVGNVFVIGATIDLVLWLVDTPSSMVARTLYTVSGPVFIGLGSGLYLGVRLGPGTRDGLMSALSRRGVVVWKARSIVEMAAFAGGLSYRNDLAKVPGANNVRKMYGELRQKKDSDGQKALGRMMRQVSNGLNGSGTGLIQLPKDYKYDDAKPRSTVMAHAIFGKSPKIEFKQPKPKKAKKEKRDPRKWRRMTAKERMKERQRMQAGRRGGRGQSRAPELNTRVSYGEWLTSAKNPRFTKVIANRMWKSVMGRGLIEPVDNIMEKTE